MRRQAGSLVWHSSSEKLQRFGSKSLSNRNGYFCRYTQGPHKTDLGDNFFTCSRRLLYALVRKDIHLEKSFAVIWLDESRRVTSKCSGRTQTQPLQFWIHLPVYSQTLTPTAGMWQQTGPFCPVHLTDQQKKTNTWVLRFLLARKGQGQFRSGR